MLSKTELYFLFFSWHLYCRETSLIALTNSITYVLYAFSFMLVTPRYLTSFSYSIFPYVLVLYDDICHLQIFSFYIVVASSHFNIHPSVYGVNSSISFYFVTQLSSKSRVYSLLSPIRIYMSQHLFLQFLKTLFIIFI